MLAVELVHLPTWLSLAVIGVILTITIIASLRAERRDTTHPEAVDERSGTAEG